MSSDKMSNVAFLYLKCLLPHAGLSEDESYDSGDIKVALDERLVYLESLKNKGKDKEEKPSKNNGGFGF